MQPSRATMKGLFAKSGNRCAFPGCSSPIVEQSGTVTGIVCHIKARRAKGPRYDPEQSEAERHALHNLMLMCGRHARLIDTTHQFYTSERLQQMKREHERLGNIEVSQSDMKSVEALMTAYRPLNVSAGGHVMVGSPGALQASTLIIKTGKASVKMEPSPGTIAADRAKRNYAKHLIDQYNDFAKQQPGRTFRYQAIYAHIKRAFGAKWDHVSADVFEELSSFLQNKIDRTMRGRVNKGKGIPNYSGFSEYIEKYEHRKEQAAE